MPAVKVGGGYLTSRRAYDKAWGDLIMAAFCPIGGRVMRRNFGSVLSQSLFAPIDNVTKSEMVGAVRSAVATHCPHIRIISVTADRAVIAGAVQNTAVALRISFTLANDESQVETRTATLDRSSVINVLSAYRAARS